MRLMRIADDAGNPWTMRFNRFKAKDAAAFVWECARAVQWSARPVQVAHTLATAASYTLGPASYRGGNFGGMRQTVTK
jgi:hypothetical protein